MGLRVASTLPVPGSRLRSVPTMGPLIVGKAGVAESRKLGDLFIVVGRRSCRLPRTVGRSARCPGHVNRSPGDGRPFDRLSVKCRGPGWDANAALEGTYPRSGSSSTPSACGAFAGARTHPGDGVPPTFVTVLEIAAGLQSSPIRNSASPSARCCHGDQESSGGGQSVGEKLVAHATIDSSGGRANGVPQLRTEIPDGREPGVATWTTLIVWRSVTSGPRSSRRGRSCRSPRAPSTAEDVKAYADAPGRPHNPLHQEEDAARAAGSGLIAHGRFTMGTLASAIVEWLGDHAASNG